jgi:hypothetical protein
MCPLLIMPSSLVARRAFAWRDCLNEPTAAVPTGPVHRFVLATGELLEGGMKIDKVAYWPRHAERERCLIALGIAL